MTKIVMVSIVLVLSSVLAQGSLTKPLQQERQQKLKEQQKPQHEALQQERKALQDKAMKMRDEKIKNKPVPQGTIATH